MYDMYPQLSRCTMPANQGKKVGECALAKKNNKNYIPAMSVSRLYIFFLARFTLFLSFFLLSYPSFASSHSPPSYSP